MPVEMTPRGEMSCPASKQIVVPSTAELQRMSYSEKLALVAHALSVLREETYHDRHHEFNAFVSDILSEIQYLVREARDES